MEDIKEAMDLIKEAYPEKIIFQDKYKIIWGNYLGPSKIQLTKKGKKCFDNLFKK